MNTPSFYLPPPFSEKKKYINNLFEFQNKSISDIAKELDVQERCVLKNLLDSYQNDQELDFDRLFNQIDFLDKELVENVKNHVIELELEKKQYSHEKGFLLKDVKVRLEDNILNNFNTNQQYDIITTALAQLHYDRWHHLPRSSRRKLIKKGGGFVTSSISNNSSREKEDIGEEAIFEDEEGDVVEEINPEDMTPYEKKLFQQEKEAADIILAQELEQEKLEKERKKKLKAKNKKKKTSEPDLASLYDLSGQVIENIDSSSVGDTEKHTTHININDQESDQEQEEALPAMKDGYNVFLTGPAGTGKSHVIKNYIKWLQDTYDDRFTTEVAVTSTTGASAVLIGGTTLHSFSGIGFGDDSAETYVNKFRTIPKYRNRWRNVKVWIIDEISMMSPLLWDKLDEIGRRLRGKLQTPFGGIQMVVSGDFCQLPTVSDKDFCFQSKVWQNGGIQKIHYLKKVFRQNDTVFQKCLEKIRIGLVDKETETILRQRMQPLNAKHGIEPTVLVSIRAHATQYNQSKMDRLIKKNKHFESFPSKYQFSVRSKSTRDRNTLQSCIDRMYQIEDPLELTIDSQVMITVNLPDLGLYNGSRGIVERFQKTTRAPVVRFLDGRLIVIPLHTWCLVMEKKKVTKIQYPLRLAWAMTIHKSQGMSLDYVHADLGSIFEYGQAYVVLSRVRSLEGLHLSSLDVAKIKAHPEVLAYEKEISKS